MIRIVALTDFTFMAISVIAKIIERNVATAGRLLTFDVAFLLTTAGRLLTFDVAFLTAVVTTSTILRAVGRGVAVFAADTAGLIQECWADDFTNGSGLVFHVVACVFRSGTTRIVADFAVGSSSGSGVIGLGGGGDGLVVSSGGGRHFDSVCVCSDIQLLYVWFEKKHFNFFSNDMTAHYHRISILNVQPTLSILKMNA
jgi:hypothetical protein